jgi:hypothetical protein
MWVGIVQSFLDQQSRDSSINLRDCLEDPRTSKVADSIYLSEEARAMTGNR